MSMLCVAILLCCVCGLEALAAKHIYAPGYTGQQGQKAGAVGFFDCGHNCHLLDGKHGIIESCSWKSIQGSTVYIEETAGWLMLWADRQFTRPMLPSEDDYKAIYHEKEPGYLKNDLVISGLKSSTQSKGE
eukprot:TRINITY_DN27055_c0_g1_i1.p1 TRINITY_DN27055_c0_g1~~TRINITY_DN27055_c0_g1_i1.p1  ORF type:complete len:131 (+),score=17.28 TRINITY_DN27055_c0_g1_i1:88-480(+)